MKVKRSVFITVVSAMSAMIVIQALIVIRPFSRRHEVTSPENAVLIAKAELIRRYGEEEVTGLELHAHLYGSPLSRRLIYWSVTKIPPGSDDNLPRTYYDYPPRVYVRQSNGRAISLWRGGVRHQLDMMIEYLFG